MSSLACSRPHVSAGLITCDMYMLSQSVSKLDQDAEGAPRPGRFQAIIDTVLGNIQLVVSNIHVRYEVSGET